MASASVGVVPRQHRLFVAAIDFGTTYSGYAFSSKDDWEKEPLKIFFNNWNAGNLLSRKASTTLLLNPDKSLSSFGYDAETKYADMIEDKENFEDYYYFHCFKMLLHNNKRLRRDTEIKDATGKPLKAMHVFSQSIKFLRQKLFESLEEKFTDIQKDDIHYVLTVPAIWDDNAKQFMREAAVKAGILEKQLSLALEPETASIYCQQLQQTRQTDEGGASFLGVAETGTRFMVVDLGGGTTDITFQERCIDGKLREIHRPMGGPWGGRNINEAFFAFIEEIFKKDVLDEFKKIYMDDYLHMERQFETKKRAFTSESGVVKMTFPLSLIELAKKIWKTDSVDEIIKNSKYAGKVKTETQKLHIPKDIFISLFLPTVDKIIAHIQKIVEDNSVSFDYILLVGGFAECNIVQKRFDDTFNDKKVIIPEEAGLAVLKGAVLYGHMPQIIATRVARHTYGIESYPKFVDGKHPVSKRVVIDGVARCKDVFFKYVTIGQEITPGYKLSQDFQVLKLENNTLECTIFASWEKNPKFITDESCFKLGTLTVPLPQQRSSELLKIEETMVFGETDHELHFFVRDKINNRTYDGDFFNLLDK